MNELKNFVKNNYVGIDTNIFMHESSGLFFDNLRRVLKENKCTCFTIEEVVQELARLSRSSDIEKSRKAQNGWNVLCQMHKDGLIDVYEKAAVNKQFADVAWLCLFNQMRMSHSLGFLSQDNKLCLDIMNHVNGVASVQASAVKVRRINAKGELTCFHFVCDDEGRYSLASSAAKNTGDGIYRYKLCSCGDMFAVYNSEKGNLPQKCPRCRKVHAENRTMPSAEIKGLEEVIASGERTVLVSSDASVKEQHSADKTTVSGKKAAATSRSGGLASFWRWLIS